MITPDSKVFLLPKEHTSFKIVKIPNADKSDSSYVLADNSLYELKALTSTDPKSFIFEGDPGYVRESDELIVSSKFSIVYLLISLLYTNENYITSENLIDANEWLSQLPEVMVEHQLERICETITENGEEFYKISKDKTLRLLTDKINGVKDYLKTSSLVNQIKIDLYTNSEEEIKPEILDLELTRIGSEMIQSYLSIPLEKEINEYNKYDFSELSEHKNKVQRQLMLQEQQMIQDSGKSQKTAKTATKGKGKAKTVKKVAVGKGALDSFFKKKVA